MKIRNLRIEQFGHWRDLALMFDPHQFNAMFGPNEAGKTTLMRFIRGVLFGFSPSAPRMTDGHCAGEIEVEHRGETWRIRRTERSLTLSGPIHLVGDDAQRKLNELLCGVTQATFEAVFCFGLEELQAFALLHGDEIVEKLFSVSLGPEGRFVLDGLKHTHRERERIAQGLGAHGTFRQGLDEHDRLSRELDNLRNDKDRSRSLRTELDRLENSIARGQARRNDIHHERKGHQFLQRVHGPWREERELKQRLKQIPLVEQFPANGVAQLDNLDREIHQCRQRLAAHRETLKQLKQHIASGKDSAFGGRLRAVEVLLDQHSGLVETSQESVSLREELRELDAEIREFRQQNKLESRSLSPAMLAGNDAQAQSLIDAANGYRGASRNLSLARKRIDKLSHAIQQTQEDLKNASRSWQGQSASQMLERTRREIALAESRAKLEAEVKRLADLSRDRESQLRQLTEREPLPKGARYLLNGFAIAGAILAVLGIWQGVTVSGLAGAVYFLLGLTCSGLGIALSWHFGEAHQNQISNLEKSLTDSRKQQQTALNELRQIGERSSKDDSLAMAERLRAMQLWTDREEKLVADRKRASQLRARVQELRRTYSQHREQWCQALRRCGLTETLREKAAWQEWNLLRKLAGMEQRRRDLEHRLGDLAAGTGPFEQAVRKVEEALTGSAPRNSTSQILQSWRTRLDQYQLDRQSLREKYTEYKQLQDEITQLMQRGKELRGRRADLLASAGATDRRTFDDRARWYAERVELEQLWDVAKSELAAAAASEPELAVVEDDLIEWNEHRCRETLLRLSHELEALEHELESAYERRGELRHELDSLGAGDREAELRQRQAELEERLLVDCERLLGVSTTADALRGLRDKLEREHRPETLVRAERHFRSLTAGRYQRVWAPLGEKDLLVEDHTGETKRLNDLSGGTREQLLLALRLALVEELRLQGVELPFLLDDILVNFDHNRVASAFDTLMTFAREGSQTLMLTCHQHLADELRNRGTNVTTLPERTWSAERMAG